MIASGTSLLHYRVVEKIGEGGMGAVWKATDATLDRDVAIKVLPVDFASDAERLARFEREAKVLASLNHPNIGAIYGFHEAGGIRFLAMELVPGEDLAQRLEKGTIPLSETVDMARQIAEPLEYAHERGIVHRDLKPANIKISPEGTVKLLDFGLAKAVVGESGTSGPTSTPTILPTVTIAGTAVGMILGTAAYMSPEQARGKPVDKRADIWAFGVVLFEMLAGRPLFDGETVSDTIAAVLTRSIDLDALPKSTPAPLRRLLARCLERDPKARLRDIGEARIALESPATAEAETDVAAATPKRPAWMLAMAAIVLVALTAVAMGWLWPAPAAPSWTGVRLGGPEVAMCPRISPDGSMLAFIAMDGNMTQVAVMKPESGTSTILTHKRNAGYVTDLSWARDGSRIYFDRISDVPMGVFSVPVFGGSDEQLVAEDSKGPAALPDGSLLLIRLNAERKYRLFHFWPDTGRWQELPIEPAFFCPAHVFDDGREAAIAGTIVSDGQSDGRHLYVLDLGSGRTRRLPTGFEDDSSIGSGVAVTRDGQSVLAVGRTGNLYRIVTIPRNGGAAPRAVLSLTMAVNYLDVGPDGRIYADQTDSLLSLWRFSPEGGHAEKIATIQNSGSPKAAVLPDGGVVVPESIGGHSRLMVIEAGKDPRPLAMTQEDTAAPVTTVGSGDVAFLIGQGPQPTIAIATVANGRITRRIPFEKGPVGSLASSPDGQTLYVAAGGTIWSMPASAASGGDARRIRPGNSAAVDPLGQHLLVQMIETPKSRLFDVPLSGGAEREIPLTGPYHLTFVQLNSGSIGRDGRLLAPLASPDNWFFRPGVVDLATGRMAEIAVDHFGDYHFVLWAPDGRVIAGAYDLRSTLWRFQPDVR